MWPPWHPRPHQLPPTWQKTRFSKKRVGSRRRRELREREREKGPCQALTSYSIGVSGDRNGRGASSNRSGFLWVFLRFQNTLIFCCGPQITSQEFRLLRSGYYMAYPTKMHETTIAPSPKALTPSKPNSTCSKCVVSRSHRYARSSSGYMRREEPDTPCDHLSFLLILRPIASSDACFNFDSRTK